MRTLPILQQFDLQLLNFPTQGGDGPRAFVLVDRDFVLDVPCPVRVLQRAERFHEVPVARRHAGYHYGLTVAPQRVLQKPRELRVAVGYVQGLLGLVAQRRNHVSQCKL